MEEMTSPPPPSQRFRRLLGLSAFVAMTAIIGGLLYLHGTGTPLRLHLVLAMSLGVGLSVLLAGALMGLAFFSARSGHDDSVKDDWASKED